MSALSRNARGLDALAPMTIRVFGARRDRTVEAARACVGFLETTSAASHRDDARDADDDDARDGDGDARTTDDDDDARDAVRARGDDATTTRSRRDALASMGLLCASVAFAARANEDDEEEGWEEEEARRDHRFELGDRTRRGEETRGERGVDGGVGVSNALEEKRRRRSERFSSTRTRSRMMTSSVTGVIWRVWNRCARSRERCARTVALTALALNAGVEYSGDPVVHRTKENFEETVGVNHLGHFLLANMLLDELEKSSETHPRIVVTASEVHDPASPGGGVGKGATLGDLSGIETQGAAFEMASGEEFDADKAYKDSKLMNLLFTYELERRLRERNSKITVNAFGPGLITRTGLFRNQNPLFVKVFDFAVNNVFHVAETVSGGGDVLVFMLTDPSLGGDRGGLYYNNTLSPGTPPTGHAFVPTESSKESNDVDEARRLWALSESLVGL